MRALQFSEYGPSNVLTVADVPEPHAGPGQVRVRVHAAAVNPIDWKVRRGLMTADPAPAAPVIVGSDASGVVDEVGDGVEGIAVGDAVFGSGPGASADYAVLDHVALKPASLSFTEAAGIPMAAETAARAFALVPFSAGDTVLVDGAAGGVGSAAVQLAVARGAHVVGTASEANHDYLRSLGATPVAYGPGLPERVRAATDAPVTSAVDVSGRGSLADLVEITGSADKVVTIANFSGDHGVRSTSGADQRHYEALAEVARLVDEGRFVSTVENVFDLTEGAAAQDLSEAGHVRGKIVLTLA